MRNTKKGFTLVELLVVIAILAILATVSVVGYTSFIDRANQSTALQEMTQIRDSVIAEDILNPNFSISGGTITVADNTDTSYPNFNDYVKSLTDALGEGRSFDELATGANALVLKNTDKKVQATWSFADNTIETDKYNGNDETPGGGEEEPEHTHVWSDATCIDPQKCTCGATQGEANPDAHDMIADPESFVAATCTTDGSEAGTKCSRCTHKVAGAVIPAAHSFAAEWTSDSAQHWHACSIAGCTGKSDIGNHTWVNGECSVCHKALPETATISFADVANRTEFDADHQVWKQNHITVTNNQGASQSNVGDYVNPARFYQSSELIIEYPGMRVIEFTCSSASYATALYKSISTNDNVKAICNDTVVTVAFVNEAVDTYTIASLGGQTRVVSIKVSKRDTDIPVIPDEPDVSEATVVSKTTNEMAALAGVATTNGTSVDGKNIKIDGNITVTFAKGSASNAPAIYKGAVRLYQKGAVMTISAANNVEMKTVVITYNGTKNGNGNLTVTGGTLAVDETSKTLTITVDADATEVVITTGGSQEADRVYVTNVEVTYAK